MNRKQARLPSIRVLREARTGGIGVPIVRAPWTVPEPALPPLTRLEYDHEPRAVEPPRSSAPAARCILAAERPIADLPTLPRVHPDLGLEPTALRVAEIARPLVDSGLTCETTVDLELPPIEATEWSRVEVHEARPRIVAFEDEVTERYVTWWPLGEAAGEWLGDEP